MNHSYFRGSDPARTCFALLRIAFAPPVQALLRHCSTSLSNADAVLRYSEHFSTLPLRCMAPRIGAYAMRRIALLCLCCAWPCVSVPLHRSALLRIAFAFHLYEPLLFAFAWQDSASLCLCFAILGTTPPCRGCAWLCVAVPMPFVAWLCLCHAMQRSAKPSLFDFLPSEPALTAVAPLADALVCAKVQTLAH